MEINPLAIAPTAPKSTDVASKDVTSGFKKALADAKAVSAPEPDGPEPPPSPPPGIRSPQETAVKEEVVSQEPNAPKPQLDLTSPDSEANISAEVATSTDADLQLAQDQASDQATSLKDAAKTSKAAMQYLLAAMQPGAFAAPIVTPPPVATPPTAALPDVTAAVATPAVGNNDAPVAFDVDNLQPGSDKEVATDSKPSATSSTGTKPAPVPSPAASTKAVVDLSGLKPQTPPTPDKPATGTKTSPRLANKDSDANQAIDPNAGAKPTGPKTAPTSPTLTLPEAPEGTTIQVVSGKDAKTLTTQEVATAIEAASPKPKATKEPLRAGMTATRIAKTDQETEPTANPVGTQTPTAPAEPQVAGTKKTVTTPALTETPKESATTTPINGSKPSVNDQATAANEKIAGTHAVATTTTDEAEDTTPILETPTDAKGPVFATQTTEKTAAPTKTEQVKAPLSPRDTTLVVRQVADRIEMMAATRPKDGITIHLNPVDLGSITMTVKAVGSLVDTQILASNDNVRDALEQSRPQLAAQMHSRGFQLNNVTLGSQSHNPNGMGESMTRQQQQQQQQQQHQQRTAQAEAKAYSAQYDKEASNPTPSRPTRQDRSRSLDLTI